MQTIRPELGKEFKGHSVPPEIIIMFVYMKLRFSLSYCDLEEMMGLRGSSIDHATVQRWIIRFYAVVRKRSQETKEANRWKLGDG